MAIKNKTTKKTKSKRSAGKTMTPMKKAVRKKLAKRRAAPKKKLAQKKVGPKKSVVKRLPGKKSRSVDTVAVSRKGQVAGVGEQLGDLQRLSNVASADSESVDELLEEGNTFEAEAVKGVEDAEDVDEEEVHTHEVPEDDVPGEYLEKE